TADVVAIGLGMDLGTTYSVVAHLDAHDRPTSITNINSHSLGIIAFDPQLNRHRNQILIPKNTPLPKTVTGTFKTHKDNQATVAVRIVEGESERPEACIGQNAANATGAQIANGNPILTTGGSAMGTGTVLNTSTTNTAYQTGWTTVYNGVNLF